MESHTSASRAPRLGASNRIIERALADTICVGSEQAARKIRLQKVAQTLATEADLRLADLATRMGYPEQAHLTSNFRQ